jgi:hypothetical protein
VGAAVTAAGLAEATTAAAAAVDAPTKRIRVGLIGCGSVSGRYLPHLSECPYAEVVSVCDIIPERAAARAKEFNVPNQYPHISKMLAGAPFDLMVTTTDMQEHEHLNREAIAAGKHIWSEKPIANTLAAGRELLEQAKTQGVRVWGAPVVGQSAVCLYGQDACGEQVGPRGLAHANYGHQGPIGGVLYQTGGGMPDLAPNLTSLTGLLGPASRDGAAQS